MSSGPTPPRRRGGGWRLVLVAVAGAAAVLGYQSLAGSASHSGGSPAAAQPPGAAGLVAGSSATGATGAPSRGGAGTTGTTGTTGPTGTRAAGDVAGGPSRVSVSGPQLVVVVDRPSGAFAQQNRLINQGAMVELAQLDAAGGLGHHGVRLVTEQLDNLSPVAVQARLKAAGAGAVLVLPCDADSQLRLANGAKAYRTLMLAPCDADAALARSIPTYWPVGMAGDDEAAGLAGFMQRIGYQDVYVLDTPGLTYTTSMTAYFRQAVAAKRLRIAGSTTVSLALSPTEIARAAAAIKASGQRTTAVFSALPPPYVDELAAGLARDGVHKVLLGTSAMDTPLTLAKGASALENATFASYGFLEQDPAANGFLDEYRARFGLPVGSFPGLGFETIRLLAAAVSRAGSTSPAAIGQALSSGLTLTGVALADRSYAAGGDHNPISSVSVEKISSGSFLPLLTADPTDVPQP